MPKKIKGMGFASQVRLALQEIASTAPASVKDIARKLDLVSNADKQPLYNTLRDFVKSGEIERTESGMFIYKVRKSQQKPELREILWRVLRSRRSVTIDDLVELSGASTEYIKKWLQMLTRQEVITVDKTSGQKTFYVLVTDPVTMPTDDKNPERLRLFRERKKEALAALDAAAVKVLEVRRLVADLEQGGES